MVGQCRQPQPIIFQHTGFPKNKLHVFSHIYIESLTIGCPGSTTLKVTCETKGPMVRSFLVGKIRIQSPDAHSTMCWALDIHCSQHCLPWYRSTFFLASKESMFVAISYWVGILSYLRVAWIKEMESDRLKQTTLKGMLCLGETPRNLPGELMPTGFFT